MQYDRATPNLRPITETVNIDPEELMPELDGEQELLRQLRDAADDNPELIQRLANLSGSLFAANAVLGRTLSARITIEDLDSRSKNRKDSLLKLFQAGSIDDLKRRVVGQDDLIDALMDPLITRASGLGPANKPIGSFLITGQTGCGKTYVAEQIAQIFFQGRIVRVDCTEYGSEHTASKLFGPPPGYVGYEAITVARKLAEMEEKGGGVLLFDEIEKAHPSISQTLLKLTEIGEVTDSSSGRLIKVRNCLIIFTSNLGVSYKEEGQRVQIGLGSESEAKDIDYSEHALTEYFSAEFLGRLNATLFANPLTKENCNRIAGKHLRRVRTPRAVITFDKGVAELISERAFSHKEGARAVKKTIEALIASPIARALEMTPKEEGPIQKIHVAIKDGKIKLILGRAKNKQVQA